MGRCGLAIVGVVLLGAVSVAKTNPRLEKALASIKTPDNVFAGLDLQHSDDPQCSIGAAYIAREVEQRLVGLKNEVLRPLRGLAEASALVGHIEARFPLTFSRQAPNRCYRYEVVSVTNARTAEQAARVFIKDVKTKGSEELAEVRFTSEPSAAIFKYWPGDSTNSSKDLKTDNTERDVARGDYGYVVKLDGYKTIEGFKLDLWNGTRVKVTCTMVSNKNTSASATPCNRD